MKMSYKPQSGLTLIEVLVALAIIAIALTAIIKAGTQNIRSTAYLQNKTTALLIAQNTLNEARVGLLPLSGESTRQETTALGKKWYLQIESKDTPNKQIKKIIVNVFSTEDEEQDPMVTLEGYSMKESKT